MCLFPFSVEFGADPPPPVVFEWVRVGQRFEWGAELYQLAFSVGKLGTDMDRSNSTV